MDRPAGDITQVLDALDGTPIVSRRPPWSGLAVELAMSAGLRRLVPAAVAVRFALVAGRLVWRVDEGRRARATAAARAILSGTEREAEVEAVARRRIGEELASVELAVRPWRVRRARVRGAENLEAAAAAGRGVIVSKIHAGVLHATVPAVARHKRQYAVVSDWALEPQPPGRSAHESEALRTLMRDCDGRFLRARGSYPVVAALLRRGEAVTITFDMPGGVETRYLGSSVRLAGGTARLALDTGALVLPCTTRREGSWLVAVFEPPLDPLDFEDAAALHASLAEIHTRLALAAPEAVHDPCRPGHWAAGMAADSDRLRSDHAPTGPRAQVGAGA